MTDRALLARAREVLKPFGKIADYSPPHWHNSVKVSAIIGDCRRARALHAEITAALADDGGKASETTLAKLVMDWVAGHASEVDMVLCASKITAGEAPAPSTLAANLRTGASASGRGQPAPELPERRCDQCDNGIERSWMFCAWCAWSTCIDEKPPAPAERKE